MNNIKKISIHPKYISRVDKKSSYYDNTGNDGGGGGMESRVAKLESDVEHIKTTMNDMKSDLKAVTSYVGTIKTDVALILQKMGDISSSIEKKANSDQVAEIDSKVSKRPTEEQVELKVSKVETKISGLKIWFLTILLFSIAMPVIMFLLNLYMRKP
ncbi:hypothetical protein [Xenorhabdus bovienii]|uniref:Uncharacterized protein n=1 Tax=Xenorhabdus bovienii str. puntauvense TaxID=1398201 RepID=A0A077NKI4_XENBV|nr:hypothetical protein [Xenorhabdus bovienii]CDG87258.1 hypothetical protein XBFFR1_170002 [Xenorhabdus bovienii str. feltiae France]CDG91050.1 hypothetical protein XBFFL1_1250008 [Xenorhabdus bovienii str. feltiae Florida]CDG98802.1 hypothetical protein XBP1_530001 [Xenorhabdus bovienii str. puntauvense]